MSRFPVMTGSPVMQGYLQGMQGRNMSAEAKMKEEQLKTLPEMMAAQLLLEQQKAKGAEITNQYLPDQLMAQIALNRAHIPLLGAQTAHMNAQTQAMPFDQMLEAQRALNQAQQTQQSMNRFGQAYQLNRFLQSPIGQELYAKNSQFAESANRVMSGTADAADQQLVGQMSGSIGQDQLSSSLLPALQKAMQQKFGFNPNQQQMTQSQLNPQDINARYGLTPELLKDMQSVAASDVEKKITPTAIQQQRTYALSAENILNGIDSKIDQLAKYSGLMGAAKIKANQAKSAVGLPVSDDYKQYAAFVETEVPILANEIKRGFGGQATDSERQLMEDVSNPINWMSNPDITKKKYQTLRNALEKNIQAITMRSSDVKQQLEEGMKKNYKNSPLQMPTFQSKEEAKAWYLKNRTGGG